ncbi:MAG: tRNA uridine-5-carboxymethylaminomethyl(34) synthesis GTPase MnmE [Treponema sp.]|jgi:tRNA modification GTPase|nr:tRNA uridine-5-carboxymethylaminomethyl(34) synthesis GTPase MnmE [Treponema sp.]
MIKGSYGDDAPIAAHATPLGESALAVIRISGKSSIDIFAKGFSRPKALVEAPGNTIVYGWVLDNDNNHIDELLTSVFRAPRSYTGEDSLDISCHGGIAAAKAIMKRLRELGFREALPGEFTFRAFMNGKLDLTKAESVMELVSAKSDESRSHAVSRLSGALESEINSVKDLLVGALASTELFLDYSEDDGAGLSAADGGAQSDEAAGRLPDRSSVLEALHRIKRLSDSYSRERLFSEGALVVIAGRPNSGKSSLFNTLLKEDRSIVTDIPGTTRDWIEAWIAVGGIPIRLIDTAGFQESSDPVELLGIERSRSFLHAADLVLYLVDGKEGIREEDRAFIKLFHEEKPTTPMMLLWNKVDAAPLPASLHIDDVKILLPISAKKNLGIDILGDEIASILEKQFGGNTEENDSTKAGIATERQKELINRAEAALTEALELADAMRPLDIIAPCLREAVNALGEITGEVSTADILDAMFSRFCIGK